MGGSTRISRTADNYAHGRPLRIDEDEDSRHNLDAPAFSMREVIKSLRRMNVISDQGDFFDRAGELYDVLGSTMCITFYWRRAGEFISSYVSGVAYDAAYHPRVADVVEAAKPLNIPGCDCL